MQNYDVVIIGGGISGLMTAYQLRNNDNNIKIAIVDKGKKLENRKCPASEKSACMHCKTCSITSGYAGAGAFSDGKFNMGINYGGTLGEELGETTAMQYISYMNDILNKFYDSQIVNTFGIDDSLKKKCLQNNLKLLDMEVKHYGTDGNLFLMNNLIKWLDSHYVDMFDETVVTDIIKLECKNFYSKPENITEAFAAPIESKYCIKCNTDVFYSKIVVIATGRNGADFVNGICDKFSIPCATNAVDIGVRVEMKDLIWKDFSSKIYEPKILYKTKTFEDNCRMFCFNPGGIVSAENNDGIITANGHSFSDDDKRTENCNFAILSSINFTEPFNKPTAYAQNYSSMANVVGAGNVIVQRFGDLTRGRRTNEKRLNENTVKPTLKATAGDLSLVLPYRILTNIIETIYALDRVAPGTANDDTLLYGCEAKYYSSKPKHDKNFMIYDNIYLIGDGSGICRGLSQSGAMGLYVADMIISYSDIYSE